VTSTTARLVSEYSFSWRAIFRCSHATPGLTPRGMDLVRAVSTEGFGRLKYHREVRKGLDEGRRLLLYFEQETTELPEFYLDLVRQDLGPLWEWLPKGALHHDPPPIPSLSGPAPRRTAFNSDRRNLSEPRRHRKFVRRTLKTPVRATLAEELVSATGGILLRLSHHVRTQWR
jgi:hypothetical protein